MTVETRRTTFFRLQLVPTRRDPSGEADSGASLLERDAVRHLLANRRIVWGIDTSADAAASGGEVPSPSWDTPGTAGGSSVLLVRRIASYRLWPRLNEIPLVLRRLS